MLYFDDVVDSENLFTEEFKQKLKDQPKSLDIQKLSGHLNHYKARINDNERAFFKIEKGKIILLYHLSHKKQDQKLKNNKRLSAYLNTTNIKLNLFDLTQFDSAFDTFQDRSEEQHIKNLFRDDCLTQPLSRAQWKDDHFIVLDDIQEAAVNTKYNHLVYGLPGSGKTTALEELCKEGCKQQLLSQGETKAGDEEQHIILVPHARLARSLANGLAVELIEYPFLSVQDLGTFAKLIDPTIAMLEAQCKEHADEPTARRGIQDFIQWCHTQKVFVEQPKHQDKKNPLEPEDCYTLLYMECKEIANSETKQAYLSSPSQISVLENNPKSRERRFTIYVQYCRENLVGSRIPPEDDESATPVLDTTMPSPAQERGIALGKPIGYDLNFYDLLPALLKQLRFRKIHTFYLDEVHNFPKLFLSAVSSLGCKIQAAGDSDQGLYDILSPLEHMRQIFNFRAKKSPGAFKIHAFMTPYRSSQAISRLLTQWLTLQNMYFPNINNTIQNKAHRPANTLRGAVNYFSGINAKTGDVNPEIIEKYKVLCANNPNMVFVVSDDKQAELLQETLGTPLVLTWDEIGGLEYKHLVIIGDIFTKFRKVLEKYPKATLATTQKSVRPKNRREIPAGQELLLEMHKIYVILSRAIESLDIDNINGLREILSEIAGIQPTCIQEVFVHTEEQKSEAEFASQALIEPTEEEKRSDWIKRCNEFIQQAFEEGTHKKKKLGFLNKAKNIFKARGLKARELQLPSGIVLPEEFECFLPDKAFINTVLQSCNTENIKKLFNKELNELEELLFLPIQDAHGNDTTLWDAIFNNTINARLFLMTAVSNSTSEEKLGQILEKNNSETTMMSSHYYAMLCMSKLWITGEKPEYKKINEITKRFIVIATNTSNDVSDELYYALSQRALCRFYEQNNKDQSQIDNLHRLSSPVLFAELMHAIEHKDQAKTDKLLRILTSSELNSADENGFTPLMRAAQKSCTSTVDYLIKANVDLDRANTNKETALIIATKLGHEEIINQLLPQVSDAAQLSSARDIASKLPDKCIENAIKARIAACAGATLDQYMKVIHELTTSATPNFKMLFNKKPAVLDKLLFLGFKDSEGNTSTLWDKIFSDPEKAQSFLLTAGTDQSYISKLRQIFNKFKTDATKKSKHYYIMLCLSGSWITGQLPEHKEVNALTKQLILASSRRFNTVSDELFYAIHQRDLECIIDNKTQSENLHTISSPVLFKECMKALKNNDADTAWIILPILTNSEINTTDEDGSTPLMIAAKINATAMITFLLDKHVDVNQKNKRGETALTIATTQGHEVVVEKLLPFITDGDQLLCASRIAFTGNHRSIEQKITKHRLILSHETWDIESPSSLQTQHRVTPSGISENEITFIHLVLKRFNSSYVSVLLLRPDAQLLLLTKTTLNGNLTTLWDIIFSDRDKTEVFLRVAVKFSSEFLPSKHEEVFREILFSKFTKRATEMSTHYYTMLTMNDIWMSEKRPEYKKINQLTKDLIVFATNNGIGNMPDELYYAIQQRALYYCYFFHHEVTYSVQMRNLYNLSHPILVKHLILILNDTKTRSLQIELTAETIISKLTENEINDSAYEGIKPLTAAAERGHKSIVVRLLPNIHDISSLSIAFRGAQRFGHADIAKIIEERGLEWDPVAWKKVTSRSAAPNPVPLLLAKREPKELIDITQLGKEATLHFLYIRALFGADYQTKGDYLAFQDKMQLAIIELFEKQNRYFDVVDLGLGATPINVNLSTNSFDPSDYDKIHGPGAAKNAVDFALQGCFSSRDYESLYAERRRSRNMKAK